MKKIPKFLFMFTVFYSMFSAPAIAATEIRDTEIETFIYELVEPLAVAAGISDGRLKIHILSDNDFNAFTAGGEDVYIYTGLISKANDPNILQAVISHELGHMIGGHMAQMSARMNAEMKRILVMQALGIALMVANPGAGVGVLAGSSGVAKQSMLAFSRDEERIADDMGIDLMVRAGLNPDGFIKVMNLMGDIQSEDKLNPLQTNHPLTSERLKNIKSKIDSLKLKKQFSIEKSQIKNYKLIRAKLSGYLDNSDRVTTMYPFTDKSDAAIYARATAAMRSGNLAGAKTGTLTLVSRSPENPYFYELLGDIEYQYGHYDDSVTAYEKSLSIIPYPNQIQTALALVLSERKKPGDIERAIEMSKRAILSEPTPLAYYVLSKSEQSRGNSGVADWAMAEYYNLLKDSKNAKKYARSAMEKLSKKSPEYLKSGDILKN